jgi:hypothetical protein
MYIVQETNDTLETRPGFWGFRFLII